MTELNLLIPILIKYVVIPNYTPAEDVVETSTVLLTSPIKTLLKKHSESINKKLSASGFSKDQIKTIKTILSNSADRFIPNTPASIYESNADSLAISRQIYNGYLKAQELGDVVALTKVSLANEFEKEQIIKGICLIIQNALDLCLTSPEYAEYLTIEQNKTNTVLRKATGEIENHEERIKSLEQNDNQNSPTLEQKKTDYYKYVLGQYAKPYTGNKLLGEESLSELYMQPYYYKSKNETEKTEPLIEEFISTGNSGVLWIVGEPGHGKTSMCIKAVADYVNKKRYQSAEGVFWFRLNPQGTKSMVSEQGLDLENVFTWGRVEGNRKYAIDPDKIGGSLVFFDGYDELKTSLEKYKISDNEFYSQVNEIAKTYCLHIVITSRTRALEHENLCSEVYLKDGSGKISCMFRDGSSQINNVKLLAPLTDENQLTWIDELIKVRKEKDEDTSDLYEYRQTFPSLQKNDDVSGLLKVPILLRMIVQNCFEPSSDNRVELYDDLFEKTLIRQGLDNQKKTLHKVYQKIAFKIFVYDDDCTEIEKDAFAHLVGNDAYLYQYYLRTPEAEGGSGTKDKCRLAFLHRSFYQYFLSDFFYEKLCKINNVKSGEDFLKYLWARHLDPYVLENLQYRVKGESIEYRWILEAVDKTDGILPEYANTSDTQEHIGNLDKANNTFWNTVSLCNSMFQKGSNQEKFELTERSVELLSKYNCSGMSLKEALLQSADLSYTNLRAAHLSSADLSNANLRNAYLSSAVLSNADLSNANLSNANLYDADLYDADLRNANLSNANLYDADLSSTILSCADLSSAYMLTADMSNADLSNANLSSAVLSSAVPSCANLGSTYIEEAVLYKTNLTGADVGNAKVTKEQYDYIATQAVKNFDKIIVIDDE